MAEIIVMTTAADDAAIAFAVAVSNARRARELSPLPAETAEEYAQRWIRLQLDRWLGEHNAAIEASRESRYSRASVEDRATIDAVLERYATDAVVGLR